MKRGTTLSKERTIELYQEFYPPQTANKNFVLSKAFGDEELFILRAMDETAPIIILEWIKENYYTANEDTLRSAFESALRMKKYEDKKRVK